jgi:hypothetical protein
MKVRMKVSISGTRAAGGSWPPSGAVIEVDDGEGVDLCSSGLAEPVADRGREERAVAADPVEVRAAEADTATAAPESPPLTTATGPTPRAAVKR